MTGYVDHALATVPHHCRPPAVRLAGFDGDRPWVHHPHPAGTRYHCDGCGAVWVVWDRPTYRGPTIVVMGGLEWRRETRKERRQRLGLRWWQRG